MVYLHVLLDWAGVEQRIYNVCTSDTFPVTNEEFYVRGPYSVWLVRVRVK